ncbi:MAG: cytochrome c oxidase subunit [Acidimicrobiaceae bacterium]|nr:cytochrome c oxidase subunit [Acidimicrobiaceae bacterium]MDQ1370579.1 cytochrome c oxidase subunit [Acidimicrobiaceae bacterium]MDQ1398419.1 cytochrome c oxidase subunit [Acidimicrobiaceae bacterium]MDQ1414491.1 cytochrome c oxidase subunit [Acidimicrobiaceae bacterium]MDQ1442685.1 cytochrome c oxidase subunit [Acidimicrobiaceae bacterium]
MPPALPRRWQVAVARTGGWLLAGLTAAVLLAACTGDTQPRYGMPQPVTKQGHSILHLWQGVFVTALVVGVVVWSLILWSVFRYRKRGGDEGLPKQTQYHIPLEITYTIIPIIIVAVIFVFVVKVENRVDSTAAAPAVSVRVEAFQWGWRFTYLRPDGTAAAPPIVGDQLSPPTLTLPAFTTVRLTLISADVPHSFYVPNFLFKRDLIPKVDNTVELYVDKVGTFAGHCAEFCGLHHPDMGFQVVTVPQNQFAVPGAST